MPSGVEVSAVDAGAPADGELEVGDVIVEANGKDSPSTEDSEPGDGGRQAGRDGQFGRARGAELTVTVGTKAIGRQPAAGVIGITSSAAFDLPVDIKIDPARSAARRPGSPSRSTSSTSSAKDIDHGEKVVVTGELDLDGTVAPIGGIKQKTIGARDAGADIFLVPDDNCRRRAQVRGRAQDRPGHDLRRSVVRTGNNVVCRSANRLNDLRGNCAIFRGRSSSTRA